MKKLQVLLLFLERPIPWWEWAEAAGRAQSTRTDVFFGAAQHDAAQQAAEPQQAVGAVIGLQQRAPNPAVIERLARQELQQPLPVAEMGRSHCMCSGPDTGPWLGVAGRQGQLGKTLLSGKLALLGSCSPHDQLGTSR